MSDEKKKQDVATKPAETDGWVEAPVHEAPDAPLAVRGTGRKPSATDELWTTKNIAPQAASGVPLPDQPGVEKKPPKPEPLSDIGPARGMAILAHTSILLALPVFLVPMLQKDNPLALQHSKAAGINFIFFVLFGVLAVLTRGVATPLMFLCYIPSLIGIVNAANGDRASFWALGTLGEKVFGAVANDDEFDKLPHDD